MKKIALLLLVAFSFTVSAQESVLLRLKYNKGDQYLVKINMDQDMSVMKMNMIMEMQIDVKDVQDFIYDTEMRFTRVATDMEQAGMKMKYDSNTKDEDLDESAQVMKAQMKPILEMVVGAKANDLGEIKEIKIIEGQGNADDFKQSNSVVYPKEPVKVGTTWSDEKTQKGMKLTYTYTVESITADTVVLDVKGTVSELAEGTFSGKANVERKSGLPVDSRLDMNMKVMGQEVKTKMSFTYEKIK